MKNKYEDIEMIDIDRHEDIAEIFITDIIDQIGTVGVVADKEMIEYLLDEVIAMDNTSIYYINMMDDSLYMIYVDFNGYISVVPANSLRYFRDIDHVYFDMDSKNNKELQRCIDYCVDEDKNVVLFGYGDAEFPEEKEDDAHVLVEITSDHTGFTSHISDDNSYIAYSYYSDRELPDDEIAAMIRDIYF